MVKCLICESALDEFISFGKMPIANGFLAAEQFASEYFFELKAGFCQACGMVQLLEQPAREKMFNASYPFFSSTSTLMGVHFKDFASDIQERIAGAVDPFVVEIGSNDGILLSHFAGKGIRHLGIEPSANVAEVARAKGIHTVCEFFDAKLAREIVAGHGQADAFIGANVMCHIPYMHSIVDGMRILLKQTGVAAFEDPYIGDVIENVSYDQFYDEHVFLFSVASVKSLFEAHGMELFDLAAQETHGGSMRYLIGHKGAHQVSRNVAAQLEKEKRLGLDRLDTYRQFRRNCERSRQQLLETLTTVRRKGERIVGYAATSKSTTVINYCGITPDIVEYIADTTPLKHGTYSPGAHIPVRPYEDFLANRPTYSLLFAYNHAKEIMAKEKAYMAGGGKWIVYVPRVGVL